MIWVVAQARVPEDNVLALTLEKIRAGVIPISADRVIGPITEQAREHGLDVRWTRERGLPVALIRYKPDRGRSDIVLETPEHPPGPDPPLRPLRPRSRGPLVHPTLPTRRVLQLNFPRRNSQLRRSSSPTLRSSTDPTS